MLPTRLTRRFGLAHPIVLAPMDLVSDARLANAVATAGGLGVVGGGYGDGEWLNRQLTSVDSEVGDRVGVGFITWSLARQPQLLDVALEHSPAAVYLSFGDPAPFADKVKSSGAALICQVGSIEHARHALAVGADVLAAQGAEGGGHGLGTRSTFTLVPEIADLIADSGSEALLLASGGVADGRGLAAALALGADGAVVGTRFWASREAAVSALAKEEILGLDGDQTTRQVLYDVLRKKDWPRAYNGRVLKNSFVDRWASSPFLSDAEANKLRGEYETAVAAEDFSVANVIVGEAIGLIDSIEPVAALVTEISDGAAHILARY